MTFDAKKPHNSLPKIPRDLDFNTPEIQKLLIEARAELGELKGYSTSLPNPLLLLSPAILKESVASSEIENIHTTILNVLENQVFETAEQKTPDKEVLRYREAIFWGFNKLDNLGLSTRLILGMQKELLPSEHHDYRDQQNAIQNTKTKEVLYTPPIKSLIPKYMQDLEDFLNNIPDNMDPLIACAIGHYQFEAIHPFGDGNGRTGRMLMVLHLVDSNILNLPILYISGYINENKDEYYRRLLEVTTDAKWEEYIIFMLKGLKNQAEKTKEMTIQIMDLFWELKKEIKEKDKVVYSADLVETIFAYPVITPVKLGKELGVHWTTASRYLNKLTSLGIMADKKAGKYHFYMNKRLLELINKE